MWLTNWQSQSEWFFCNVYTILVKHRFSSGAFHLKHEYSVVKIKNAPYGNKYIYIYNILSVWYCHKYKSNNDHTPPNHNNLTDKSLGLRFTLLTRQHFKTDIIWVILILLTKYNISVRIDYTLYMFYGSTTLVFLLTTRHFIYKHGMFIQLTILKWNMCKG